MISIARSVFALAVLSASATACEHVSVKPCALKSPDGTKWIAGPDGHLMRQTRRITRENVAQYAALAAVTVLDYQSTRRGIASGRVREGNPLLATADGGLSGNRFLLMSGVSAGLWLLSDMVLKPRAEQQGKRQSKAVRAIRWTMIGARAAIVANNYRIAR